FLVMSRRRPGTAGSVRSTASGRNALSALKVRSGARPSSAKEWFEAYNHRRNEEALRLDDWKNTASHFQKREFQTQVYNNIVHTNGIRQLEQANWKVKEEKARKLKVRREKLWELLKADERKYEDERHRRYEKTRVRTYDRDAIYPEVVMLQTRLEELKSKNAEERHKMVDNLAYEAWRKDHPKVRQMETERMNKFIQEAWVDQKQYKKDQQLKYEEERKKKETEALDLERQKMEEERLQEQERINRHAEWRNQLAQQVEEIKYREAEEKLLNAQDQNLEREKIRLQELIQRRNRMKDLRQRKELELCWARQYQLKLKKKAVDIQQELLEDEGIVEDLLRGLPDDSQQDDKLRQRREEADWMKTVLEEQRKLEQMREKEYDLLFSEEAERVWMKRQSEWDKEQRTRDKLMKEVLSGIQQQIQEKASSASAEKSRIDREKKDLQRSFVETSEKMNEDKQRREAEMQQQQNVPQSGRRLQEVEELRHSRAEEERRLEDHRREISHLEEEMKRLWGPQYRPPHYGRKRVAW
ncbi:unnamed protein product, partial [Meganyctiphanes norvegica]